MNLNLTKPLIVFDLETTGLDLVKDRIIQISYIKVYPDGREERENLFVNPEMPIPADVTKLTGITEEDVSGAKTFKQLSAHLAEKFKGCDFAGFNSNRFDVPLLCEEFLRAGVDFDFSKSRLIDAQVIYHKMEKRNLAAAYKFYCGRKMEEDFEAHRAGRAGSYNHCVGPQPQLHVGMPRAVALGEEVADDRMLRQCGQRERGDELLARWCDHNLHLSPAPDKAADDEARLVGSDGARDAQHDFLSLKCVSH